MLIALATVPAVVFGLYMLRESPDDVGQMAPVFAAALAAAWVIAVVVTLFMPLRGLDKDA